MKVYNGWVLEISGVEYTVYGSNKLRSNQYYYLRSKNGVTTMRRDVLLAGMSDKSIKYVTSVKLG